MIQPIELTQAGETLVDDPELNAGDSSEMKDRIGAHAICGGEMHIVKISETHKAIVCRSCNLRVTIPQSLTTYGELRIYIKLKGPLS